MLYQTNSSAKILIFGLDQHLSSELSSVLRQDCGAVTSIPQPGTPNLKQLLDRMEPDLIFCAPEFFGSSTELRARRQPVVVVSRDLQMNAWLDALDAGAADYCAAPFAASEMRWMLAKHLPTA